MDRFIIAHDVTKMLPKMQVVIVTAYNLDNQGENSSVNDFAQVCTCSSQSNVPSDLTTCTESRFYRRLRACGLPESAIPSAYRFVQGYPQSRVQSLRQKVPTIKRIAV